MQTAVDLRTEVVQRLETYFNYPANIDKTQIPLYGQWLNGELTRMNPTLVCKYAIDDIQLKSVKWGTGAHSQLYKRTMVLSPFVAEMGGPDLSMASKGSDDDFANVEVEPAKEDTQITMESISITNSSPALVEDNDTVAGDMMMVPNNDDALQKVITNVVDRYFVEQRQRDRKDIQADIRKIMTEVMGSMMEEKVLSTMNGLIEIKKPQQMESISSSVHDIESSATQNMKWMADMLEYAIAKYYLTSFLLT